MTVPGSRDIAAAEKYVAKLNVSRSTLTDDQWAVVVRVATRKRKLRWVVIFPMGAGLFVALFAAFWLWPNAHELCSSMVPLGTTVYAEGEKVYALEVEPQAAAKFTSVCMMLGLLAGCFLGLGPLLFVSHLADWLIYPGRDFQDLLCTLGPARSD